MGKIRSEIITTSDSYPYVTGMGFRNRCHLIFDEFYQGNESDIFEDGQVVFIKTDFVPVFFERIMPSIKYNVKIVTHNSALGINENYIDFLNHPQVLSWYAQNANFFHEKLSSIPLGLANSRWEHGNISELIKITEEKNIKNHLLYMNFDISTNIDKRKIVFDMFHDKPFVLKAERKSFKGYLEDLSVSKYALSPAGAGIDCHRIWECIAVGTIPIVENCHNISFYKNLPILIIEDWNNVTEDFLNSQYDNIKDKSNSYPLMIDYWTEVIGLMDVKHKTVHNQYGSNSNLFVV